MNQSIKKKFLIIIMMFSCLFSIETGAIEKQNKMSGIFGFAGAVLVSCFVQIYSYTQKAKNHQDLGSDSDSDSSDDSDDSSDSDSDSSDGSSEEKRQTWGEWLGSWFGWNSSKTERSYSAKAGGGSYSSGSGSSKSTTFKMLSVLRQPDGWSCGYHALKNSLLFLMGNSDGLSNKKLFEDLMGKWRPVIGARQKDGGIDNNKLSSGEIRALTGSLPDCLTFERNKLLVVDTVDDFNPKKITENIVEFYRDITSSQDGRWSVVINTSKKGSHWVSLGIEKKSGKTILYGMNSFASKSTVFSEMENLFSVLDTDRVESWAAEVREKEAKGPIDDFTRNYLRVKDALDYRDDKSDRVYSFVGLVKAIAEKDKPGFTVGLLEAIGLSKDLLVKVNRAGAKAYKGQKKNVLFSVWRNCKGQFFVAADISQVGEIPQKIVDKYLLEGQSLEYIKFDGDDPGDEPVMNKFSLDEFLGDLMRRRNRLQRLDAFKHCDDGAKCVDEYLRSLLLENDAIDPSKKETYLQQLESYGKDPLRDLAYDYLRESGLGILLENRQE